jgi:hypothetical protein
MLISDEKYPTGRKVNRVADYKIIYIQPGIYSFRNTSLEPHIDRNFTTTNNSSVSIKDGRTLNRCRQINKKEVAETYTKSDKSKQS